MSGQSPFISDFWHAGAENIIEKLESNSEGLKKGQAAARLKLYGQNTLKSSDKKSAIMLLLAQFKSPITLLLIIASLISAGLGDVTDTIIIFIIVLISGLLSFLQERGAANAINELLRMVQLHCTVLRDSVSTDMPVEDVVPGDIIYLSAGGIIPGDSLVLESVALFVDEAVLTGETFPVEKAPGILPEDAPLSKRSNVLFMGSHVVSGTAKAIVVNTARHTELGKISDSLRAKTPETDFEKGIRNFGYMLMEITLLLVIIIFALNVYLHKPILDSFLFSLALAVGLTPQLLPAIIGVNLSAGARRMALNKVIVKRLSSIENIGSMNILCSDKTGTITEGKVKLKNALNIDGCEDSKVMQYAFINASMQQGFHNPIDDAICEHYTGGAGAYNIKSEIPYDFIRKRLTVVVNDKAATIAITKGALSNILAVCDSVEAADGAIIGIAQYKNLINARFESLSNAGYRTLGVAYKITEKEKFERSDESDMVFLGFLTFFDPPKADVGETIANLRGLGVSLKIITGDNALVAKSLALQIGISSPSILTGDQLKQMSNAALRQKVPGIDIFAEVEPNQKEHLIFILKQAGNVVGFIGDGINDAPALHAADVGISVNTAVDVAKEAADIVLLNQDLAVLINGITEGRKTFANTMKYIFMATSANFGNMFSMAGASLFLSFLPLLPKQILLTNLMTDFPEMAIATDNVDSAAIEKPQRWDLKFIRRFMITFGLLSSIFDYLTFGVLLLLIHAGEKTFQTGWFIESVISAALIVLVVRSRQAFFKTLPGVYLLTATIAVLLAVLVIPVTPAAHWFGFTRLPAAYYGWMLLIVCAYVLSAEYTKRRFYRYIERHLRKPS